jgi:predicted RNA polymerase sigma factor
VGDDRELAGVLWAVYPRVLVRVLSYNRSLDQAEDALHDAIERALRTWPDDGRPDSPEA